MRGQWRVIGHEFTPVISRSQPLARRSNYHHSSRSEITNNFNFFNCNVNIRWSWPFERICKIFSMFSISFPWERFKNFLIIYADIDFPQHLICFRLWKNLLDDLEPTTGCKLNIIDLGKPKSVASIIYLDVVNNYTVIQHVKQTLDDFVVSVVSSQNCVGKCAKSQVLFLPTPSQSFFRP